MERLRSPSARVEEVVWVYTVDGVDVSAACALDPAVALTGTLAADFDAPGACGGYTASFTADPSKITASEAEVLACVERASLTPARKAALRAHLQGTAATDLSIDMVLIQAQIGAAVQRAVAARVPGGFCPPVLTD